MKIPIDILVCSNDKSHNNAKSMYMLLYEMNVPM